MKSYTFADGTVVPKGVDIVAAAMAIHMDPTIYANPTEFDGFRFSRMREQDGESAKHHSSNTSLEYLHFGHGHHAWYVSFGSAHSVRGGSLQ
jgi:cytochrome P450